MTLNIDFAMHLQKLIHYSILSLLDSRSKKVKTFIAILKIIISCFISKACRSSAMSTSEGTLLNYAKAAVSNITYNKLISDNNANLTHIHA